MKNFYIVFLCIMVFFSSCSANTVNIPEGYDGKKEFIGANQIILPIIDAKEFNAMYTDDSNNQVYSVEYDFAWVRLTTGLHFNSSDSPELFDIPNRQFKGFDINPEMLYYQKIKVGDLYKGYKVKEASIAFDSNSGYPVATKATFEGDITLRGTLSPSIDTSIMFHPFAYGNTFLPILSSIWGDINTIWYDEYIQTSDNGVAYSFPDNFSDAITAAILTNGKVDVEINVTELTLSPNDSDGVNGSLRIKDVKIIQGEKVE